MKIELPLTAFLLTLIAFSGISFAQKSKIGANIEQAKELSAMTGRPMLAVAGEAAN